MSVLRTKVEACTALEEEEGRLNGVELVGSFALHKAEEEEEEEAQQEEEEGKGRREGRQEGGEQEEQEEGEEEEEEKEGRKRKILRGFCVWLDSE